SGTVIGASGNVGHAAGFVGSDAADALMRHGDGIDARPSRLRIVGHRIAAGVVGPFLVLVGIALLGAEINLAAGADVIAGVDFGLGRETLGLGRDRFL